VNPAYLLDSSVCIPVLRNQAGLGKLPDPARTGIPVIVAAELWTGVKENLSTHPQQAAKLEAFLALFVIAEFTLAAAVHYARSAPPWKPRARPSARSTCSSPRKPAASAPPS